MKKLIILSTFTFVLSVVLVYGQTCDRYFGTTITYNNDFLDLHYNNTSVGNYYKIFNRTTPGETVNTNLNVIDIKKPIIIIEGYDIFYNESCDEIYSHYINYRDLGNSLRANGYDIITYNLSYPMAALQPNALIFAKFLEFINANKTGDEELIIMGVSMGGLITRYALTYMEENNFQHQTKLFLSFDSPQKGGYAPLSMQALLSDRAVIVAGIGAAAANQPELAYLINCFISDGTLQMLTHHAAEIENGYANPTAQHTNFFIELNTMNACGGYPNNCKSVAISNGSLKAETQKGLNIFGDYSGNPAVYFRIGSLFGVARGLNTVPGIDNWALEEGTCIYRGHEACNSSHGYYMEKDGLPLDHVPGGYYPWYGRLVEQLENISSVDIDAHYNDNASFVSTISALGLNTNDLLLNVRNYSKNQILQDTYFDDMWWNTSHSNMAHTSYYHSSLGSDYYALYNFIEDQIYLSESENFAQYSNSISEGSTNSGDKKLYKASYFVTVENHTVSSGSQLTLKSGNSINLKNGFRVESGATFSASIENIKTKDCNLAGNLPQFTPGSRKIVSSQTDAYKKDTVLGGYNVSMYAPININSKSYLKEPTSVFDILQKDNVLNVFPNPSTDLINIVYSSSGKQKIKIKLIEPVTGKTIKTIFAGDINSEIYLTDIDISNLSSGLYTVLIQTEKGIFSEKFIKR